MGPAEPATTGLHRIQRMSRPIDVFEMNDWDRELGAARGTRLGPRAGAVELGCALFELDPGGQAAHYHAH